MQLLSRAREGDPDALGELLSRYSDRVLRIVRIRMGARVRGVMESGDLLQETLAKAAEELHGFDPRDHAAFLRWLSRIAENRVRSAAAALRSRPMERALGAGSGEECAEPCALPADEGPTPSSVVANTELREIYDACVEALPDSYRELVLLRDYFGCSWDEVAARAGTPTKHAAQQAYRRAQIKLAGMLRIRLRT